MLTDDVPNPRAVLTQVDSTTPRDFLSKPSKRHTVYRDELLARLLIDLFLSRKGTFREKDRSSLGN